MGLLPPMDSYIAVQTLGIIVQTYISILAIISAFYIFVVEGDRSRFFEIEDRIDRNINYLENETKRTFIDIKEKGIDWFEQEIDHFHENIDFPKIRKTSYYQLLLNDYPKFVKLKEKVTSWEKEKFQIIFGLCVFIIIASIALMDLYTIENIKWDIDLGYTILVIIAIFCMLFFIGYVFKITKEYI